MKRIFIFMYFLFKCIADKKCIPDLCVISAATNMHIKQGSKIESVHHVCGHKRNKRIFGNEEQRKAKVNFYEKRPCLECYKQWRDIPKTHIK